MRLFGKTLSGLAYAALVAFYGAFIIGGIVFLWHGLFG
jgi:hypothetical protein